MSRSVQNSDVILIELCVFIDYIVCINYNKFIYTYYITARTALAPCLASWRDRLALPRKASHDGQLAWPRTAPGPGQIGSRSYYYSWHSLTADSPGPVPG